MRKSWKRGAMAAMIGLALPVGAAWAQDGNTTNVYYRAGNWEAFTVKLADGGAYCGIRSLMTPDGRGLSIRFRIGGAGLLFQAQKPSWQIPAGTQVNVSVQFDSRAGWQAVGSGNQDMVEWFLSPEATAEFDARFRWGNTMWIGFPGGSEPPWGISLAGSNAAGVTLRRCIDEVTQYMARSQPQASEPTQPFSGGAPGGQPPAGPSQPFAPQQSAPAAPATPAPAQPPAKAQ